MMEDREVSPMEMPRKHEVIACPPKSHKNFVPTTSYKILRIALLHAANNCTIKTYEPKFTVRHRS